VDRAAKAPAAEAVATLRDALVANPGVPALHVALADVLRKSGAGPQAEAGYKAAIALDPTFAPAHLGLALLADQKNDVAAARRELAEALAWHPPDKAGLELAQKLGGAVPSHDGAASGPKPRAPGGAQDRADGGWGDIPRAAGNLAGRVQPFAIFLDVDEVGAIHVATAANDAAQIYGGCRAVMRYEPELRAQLFRQPSETPYALSVAEEVICLEAALGAYFVARASNQPAPDPELDQLHRIAREDGLSGYATFEILGRHRPERARLAPLDVHRDVVRYVERRVLGRRQPLADEMYTAGR
jgi:tetratricopeptide (TPR) repeat protein